jgi:translation initiation factor 2B subunit (eIF-2B alpha/beta/delta family)
MHVDTTRQADACEDHRGRERTMDAWSSRSGCRSLRADRRHGASFLARRACEALVEVAEAPAATSEELLERVTNAGRQLAEARPGIAAVAGAVGRLLGPLKEGRPRARY